jgi:hypothetical protein
MDADVAAVRFPTSAEAEHAGWSIAQTWIIRQRTERLRAERRPDL